jgi:hypothetical protein
VSIAHGGPASLDSASVARCAKESSRAEIGGSTAPPLRAARDALALELGEIAPRGHRRHAEARLHAIAPYSLKLRRAV